MIWVWRWKAALTIAVDRAFGAAGEMSARERRSDEGWQQERIGHEVSSRIAGRGQSWGWQPGSKVSTMIMRPPQQGQVFHGWFS
jgi:hypothetical protein